MSKQIKNAPDNDATNDGGASRLDDVDVVVDAARTTGRTRNRPSSHRAGGRCVEGRVTTRLRRLLSSMM